MADYNQCCKNIKAGTQCRRTTCIQTDGQWICKQHGGKGVMPSCKKCNKVRMLKDNGYCTWCNAGQSIQLIRQAYYNIIQEQTQPIRQEVVNQEEDIQEDPQ